jgi:hypothetical protein
MTIEIETTVNEGSTAVVTASFTDENGDALAPHTLTWTLTDTQGNVINEREDVAIDTPEAEEVIILKGDDLQLPSNVDDLFVIQFNGLYDSDIGTDLCIAEDATFKVVNMIHPEKDL